MSWLPVLMFWWVVAPGTLVYVKGHSHAADKTRAEIQNLTCYRSTPDAKSSTATLEVDHLLDASRRRSWVVLVMTDSRQRVIFERKAEEVPWPLPSATNRLLKNLAKSTCPQLSAIELPPGDPGR
jgi:hypothetical protein